MQNNTISRHASAREERSSQGDVLRPETIKQFKRLNLAARIMVRGFSQGLNPSALKGCSIDFADLREYSPGDDLRLIDWKAYGRADRFFVRQFEVERDASILFLLDASPSMSFNSNGISKFDYAKYLVAALAFIGSGHHDRVGLFMSPGVNSAVLPPHRGRSHLHRLLHELSAAETNRDTDPFEAFRNHVAKLKRRAIVVVVSDLLGNQDEISGFLRRAAFGGHNVILFHLLDKAERELTFEGNIEFHDMEGPWRQIVHVNDSLREKYKKQLAQYCESVRSQCSRLGIEHTLIYTDTAFDAALITFLLRRQRLRRSAKGGQLKR